MEDFKLILNKLKPDIDLILAKWIPSISYAETIT